MVALAVASCAPNLLEESRPDYRYFAGFLCHPDGSVILAQKANSTGGFSEPTPTETAANCAPAVDWAKAWPTLDEMGRARDYRWLGIPLGFDVAPARPR